MPVERATPIRKPRAPRKAAPKPPASLADVLDAAVAKMDWLESSDAALVAVARKYAEVVDGPTLDRSKLDDETKLALDVELAKRVGWIGPHLINAIKALGGAPAERKALGIEREVKGKLAELRSARGA